MQMVHIRNKEEEIIMNKKTISIFMAIILLVTTVSLQKAVTVEAKDTSEYTTTTQNIKAKLGSKVVLKPVVYKNGEKVDLKQKDYNVIWFFNCKHYGEPLNDGAKHVIKKLKAIDCYNSSFKGVFEYIVSYKDKEIVRGTIRINAKGKYKVGRADIRKIEVNEEGTYIYFNYKKLYKATSFEVQYSLNKNFKQKKVKKQPYARYTMIDNQKLEKGKKYFVRVRGVSIINKKKKLGKWSKVKTFCINEN